MGRLKQWAGKALSQDWVRLLAERVLNYSGRYSTIATSPEEIREFLYNIHPVDCGLELIRMGPSCDGGYLLPDDLKDIVACFSPGVDRVSDFEKDCSDRGMDVFLADASVKGPARRDERFHFIPKFIGAFDESMFISMESWVHQSLGDRSGELLLQMDIEGFEWESLLAASNELMNRFRIVVLEVRDISMLWSAPFFSVVSRCFAKLLQTHVCVHLHPNNARPVVERQGLVLPDLMEMTFLRRDRVHESGYVTQFPHPLDADNTEADALILPSCWYRSKSRISAS